MPQPADFTYVLSRFPAEGLLDLRPFYDRMPVDPYITGVFRERRFGHFIGSAYDLRRLPHQRFLQSKAINQVAGGISRDFAEIEPELLVMPAFQAMVATFVDTIGIDLATREIGVHQIRIRCSREFSGSPAPEGIHQDGFDFIGIYCVDRHQILGATTGIYPGRDQEPIFQRELQPGEVVFANDRRVFHFADQVRPSSDQPGYWDLLVITS